MGRNDRMEKVRFPIASHISTLFEIKEGEEITFFDSLPTDSGVLSCHS